MHACTTDKLQMTSWGQLGPGPGVLFTLPWWQLAAVSGLLRTPLLNRGHVKGDASRLPKLTAAGDRLTFQTFPCSDLLAPRHGSASVRVTNNAVRLNELKEKSLKKLNCLWCEVNANGAWWLDVCPWQSKLIKNVWLSNGIKDGV